ncbi:hypothetical protein DERF_011094 [Dermatophagoides farinae]|uniref:Uncharacterized protein n=1 Tax=Dermatophagoides farinae TaxID=6954 RepID=A0A922HSC0_DERFA|nr:hypothetical protein DERF_011094 [Dermatophagoides farinae]
MNVMEFDHSIQIIKVNSIGAYMAPYGGMFIPKTKKFKFLTFKHGADMNQSKSHARRKSPIIITQGYFIY